jgi:hypothetical protein
MDLSNSFLQAQQIADWLRNDQFLIEPGTSETYISNKKCKPHCCYGLLAAGPCAALLPVNIL